MDEITDKWIKAAESPGINTAHDFVEAVGGIEQYRQNIFQMYTDSGNRLFLLELFIANAALDTVNKTVQLPSWIFQELADGFIDYLNDVKQDSSGADLEQSLGVTKDMKAAIANGYLNKESMVKLVHNLRYQFEMNVDQACFIAYKATKNRLAPLTDYVPPTEQFTERTFLDYYYRKDAQNFSAWKKEKLLRGENPSKEKQSEIFNVLGPDLTKRIKRVADLLF